MLLNGTKLVFNLLLQASSDLELDSIWSKLKSEDSVVTFMDIQRLMLCCNVQHLETLDARIGRLKQIKLDWLALTVSLERAYPEVRTRTMNAYLC